MRLNRQPQIMASAEVFNLEGQAFQQLLDDYVERKYPKKGVPVAG